MSLLAYKSTCSQGGGQVLGCVSSLDEKVRDQRIQVFIGDHNRAETPPSPYCNRSRRADVRKLPDENLIQFPRVHRRVFMQKCAE